MSQRNESHYKYVIDNPSATYQEFAKHFGISKQFGRTKFSKIKKSIAKHPTLAKDSSEQGYSFEDSKHYWHKSDNVSTFVKVDNSISGFEVVQMIDDILEARNLKKVKLPKVNKSDKVLNVILSDMHVGLDPNPQGRSLFNYKYNKEIFNYRLEQVYFTICKEYNTHGCFDTLVLYDLGDGLDGWNGETTRGGHKLDQNMSNVEAFKTYVGGKLDLIEKIINGGFASKIVIRSVSKCNHSGDFGYIANETIKMLIERVYDNQYCSFYILERFMEHFVHGEHCFIVTHGKDDKVMKFGMPLNLNDKTINFINSYIKHYKIDSKYVHLYKGDLHQVSYSKTKDFDYRNFAAFAPPSSWVQHNFVNGVSGYSTQVIPLHSNETSHSDYFFEFEEI